MFSLRSEKLFSNPIKNHKPILSNVFGFGICVMWCVSLTRAKTESRLEDYVAFPQSGGYFVAEHMNSSETLS